MRYKTNKSAVVGGGRPEQMMLAPQLSLRLDDKLRKNRKEKRSVGRLAPEQMMLAPQYQPHKGEKKR